MFAFNFDFEDDDLLKEELAKVIFVLIITVFELYFTNILKSKRVSGEKEIIDSIVNFNISFYEFRAALAKDFDNKKLFIKNLEHHELEIVRSFNQFKKFADEKMAVELQELDLPEISTFESITKTASNIVSR